MNVHVRNADGIITNPSPSACVEVPFLTDGTGISPCSVGNLPPQLVGPIQSNVSVREQTAEVGLSRDDTAF